MIKTHDAFQSHICAAKLIVKKKSDILLAYLMRHIVMQARTHEPFVGVLDDHFLMISYFFYSLVP